MKEAPSPRIAKERKSDRGRRKDEAYQERIENNERTLKASVEIEEEFTGDRLASDFKALEKGATGAAVDDRLLALKQKMGVLPSSTGTRGQIGAGKRDAETVSAEIEDSTEEKKSR